MASTPKAKREVRDLLRRRLLLRPPTRSVGCIHPEHQLGTTCAADKKLTTRHSLRYIARPLNTPHEALHHRRTRPHQRTTTQIAALETHLVKSARSMTRHVPVLRCGHAADPRLGDSTDRHHPSLAEVGNFLSYASAGGLHARECRKVKGVGGRNRQRPSEWAFSEAASLMLRRSRRREAWMQKKRQKAQPRRRRSPRSINGEQRHSTRVPGVS